jgi:hypothetical protein
MKQENAQRSTPNIQRRMQNALAEFDIGRSALDVRCLLLVDAIAFHSQIIRSSRAPVAQLDRASDYGSEG